MAVYLHRWLRPDATCFDVNAPWVCIRARKNRRRIHRAHKERAGQICLRLRRQRIDRALERRNAEGLRRYRDDACALQRLKPRDHRRDRGAGTVDDWQLAAGVAAHQVRQGAAAEGDDHDAIRCDARSATDFRNGFRLRVVGVIRPVRARRNDERYRHEMA